MARARTHQEWIRLLGAVGGVTDQQQTDFLDKELTPVVERTLDFLKKECEEDDIYGKLALLVALSLFCKDKLQVIDHLITNQFEEAAMELTQMVLLTRNLRELPKEERIAYLKSGFLVEGVSIPSFLKEDIS